MRPPRKGWTPGRFGLAAVVAVVAQLLLIAALGNATPQTAPPRILVDWSARGSGCGTDPNATAQVNYTIRYDNVMGPSGYAIMALGYGGHMRRLWAAYVPAGAFQLSENGSVTMTCSQVGTFRVVFLYSISS